MFRVSRRLTLACVSVSMAFSGACNSNGEEAAPPPQTTASSLSERDLPGPTTTTTLLSGTGTAEATAPTTPRDTLDAAVEPTVPTASSLAPFPVPRETVLIHGVIDPRAATGSPVCDGWTLVGALFETNSSQPAPGTLEALEIVAKGLEQPGSVTIVGHADERPTAVFGGNVGLSLARATAVRDLLVNTFHIDPSRIAATEGHGAAEPVSSDMSRNRRVEVRLICPEA